MKGTTHHNDIMVLHMLTTNQASKGHPVWWHVWVEGVFGWQGAVQPLHPLQQHGHHLGKEDECRRILKHGGGSVQADQLPHTLTASLVYFRKWDPFLIWFIKLSLFEKKKKYENGCLWNLTPSNGVNEHKSRLNYAGGGGWRGGISAWRW